MIELGQKWASLDWRDQQRGHNQDREVVKVTDTHVWLRREWHDFHGNPRVHTSRVKIVNGSVNRHALVP